MTEPRTWELPPEPGPEVTAVRDRDGDVWRLQKGNQWDDVRGLGWRRGWSELLQEFGPLTDASDEVTP